MKKYISLIAGCAFAFVLAGTVSASANQSESSVLTVSQNGQGDAMKRTVKQAKKIEQAVKKEIHQTRFVRLCTQDGGNEEACAQREERVKEGTQNLRRENRMDFVSMIVDSKKNCVEENGGEVNDENRLAIRQCFRQAVKTGIVDRIKKIRDLKKECRDELADDAQASEVKLCALQKHLGQEVTVSTEVEASASVEADDETVENEDDNTMENEEEDTMSDDDDTEDMSGDEDVESDDETVSDDEDMNSEDESGDEDMNSEENGDDDDGTQE